MKKIIALALALSVIFAFAACSKENPIGGNENSTDSATPANPVSSTAKMREKFDNMEYTLYQNIFYQENGGKEYEGKTMTKDGTFTSIYDAYNKVTRYYVWGFADQTKCCDYQWEVVMPEGTPVPPAGSYVTMTGVFKYDEAALDKYWFTDIKLTVEDEFKGAIGDFDTTTMSATLARVQIINFENFPEVFEGKTALIFGRAMGASTVQHPYYDNAWAMDFVNAPQKPAIGQNLLLTGKLVKSDKTCYLDVTDYQETK